MEEESAHSLQFTHKKCDVCLCEHNMLSNHHDQMDNVTMDVWVISMRQKVAKVDMVLSPYCSVMLTAKFYLKSTNTVNYEPLSSQPFERAISI